MRNGGEGGGGARPGEHVFGAWPLGLVLEHCRAKRVLGAGGALDDSLGAGWAGLEWHVI